MGGERRKPKDAPLIHASKFLSLVLRHEPERIGVRLDPGGWVGLAELLARAPSAGVLLSEELVRQVVEQNDKQRFALSADGLRIRAVQGHSVPVDLGLEPRTPPETLYHGTADRFLDSIREHGLRPGDRNHVHLSPDAETATAVGRRHGRAVVIEVDAARMRRQGHSFLCSDNGVWLVDRVPVEYLRFP